MATAVEPGSEPRTPTPLALPVSSLLGAIYVVAVIAIVLYGLPSVLGERLRRSTYRKQHLSIGACDTDFVSQAIAVGLSSLLGRRLLGDSPLKARRPGGHLSRSRSGDCCLFPLAVHSPDNQWHTRDDSLRGDRVRCWCSLSFDFFRGREAKGGWWDWKSRDGSTHRPIRGYWGNAYAA